MTDLEYWWFVTEVVKSVNLENLEGSVKETRSKRYLKRTKKSVRKELNRTLKIQRQLRVEGEREKELSMFLKRNIQQSIKILRIIERRFQNGSAR